MGGAETTGALFSIMVGVLGVSLAVNTFFLRDVVVRLRATEQTQVTDGNRLTRVEERVHWFTLARGVK